MKPLQNLNWIHSIKYSYDGTILFDLHIKDTTVLTINHGYLDIYSDLSTVEEENTISELEFFKTKLFLNT